MVTEKIECQNCGKEYTLDATNEFDARAQRVGFCKDLCWLELIWEE